MTTSAHRPWRALGVLAGGLALMAAVAGCGGSGDAAPSSAAASSGAAAAGNAQVLLDAQRLTVLDQPIAYPKKKAQISSSIVALEPGQETGWQKANVPMYAYVIDGTVTVEYDAGVTKEYPAGTALMQAQGVWHNTTNKGDQPAHVLVVNLGAKGVKNIAKR